MSYIGDPYQYDVFVSYPHAVEALRGHVNMREWSRKVVDDVLEYVTMSLIDEDGGENFSYYLDRDNAVNADPLTDTLEDAVQKSAVLVILMSPYYRKWCVKELEWFFAKAKDDGRGFRQCVLLEVQETSDKVWPELLRDKAGERLFREKLIDKDGLPFGFEQFKSYGTLPDTGGRLKGLAIEIKDRLIQERKNREAERALAESREIPWLQLGGDPPDGLLIYLEAELADSQIWTNRRETLESAHAVVLPDEPLDDSMENRSDDVLRVYKACDGVVLHRARLDDLIAPRLLRAFHDLRLVRQAERRTVRWAVLDELPDAPLPYAARFRIPRVSTHDQGWPEHLFQALGGPPAAAPAAS